MRIKDKLIFTDIVIGGRNPREHSVLRISFSFILEHDGGTIIDPDNETIQFTKSNLSIETHTFDVAEKYNLTEPNVLMRAKGAFNPSVLAGQKGAKADFQIVNDLEAAISKHLQDGVRFTLCGLTLPYGGVSDALEFIKGVNLHFVKSFINLKYAVDMFSIVHFLRGADLMPPLKRGKWIDSLFGTFGIPILNSDFVGGSERMAMLYLCLMNCAGNVSSLASRDDALEFIDEAVVVTSTKDSMRNAVALPQDIVTTGKSSVFMIDNGDYEIGTATPTEENDEIIILE